MTEVELEHELAKIKGELGSLKQRDEWLTAQELAPRMGKSPSYIYKLVALAKQLEGKGKNGGIPYSEPSKGTILFSWQSVNAWLHELEKKKSYWNFED